jgi:endonuclease-8
VEGPSVHLAADQLQVFRGKTILGVSGNTRIGKERPLGEEVKEIFAWGKHLVIQLDDFALRTHIMLFGSFEATTGGESLTGDYRRAREPRLQLDFENGDIKLFSCSVAYLEKPDARSLYDRDIDIMAPEWHPLRAFESVRARNGIEIADVLVDQDVFAGVGNII